MIWKKSSKIWYPSCSIGKIDVLDRHTEQVTPVRKQSLLQVDKISNDGQGSNKDNSIIHCTKGNCGLVTSTEEILDGRFHFLGSDDKKMEVMILTK